MGFDGGGGGYYDPYADLRLSEEDRAKQRIASAIDMPLEEQAKILADAKAKDTAQAEAVQKEEARRLSLNPQLVRARAEESTTSLLLGTKPSRRASQYLSEVQ